MSAAYTLSSFAPALPEIALATLACALLVVDLFLADDEKYVTYWLSLLALAGVGVLTVWGAGHAPALAFNGMFVSDLMSQVLKAAVLLSVAATLLYGREYLEARGLLTGEFLSLSLFAALGMMMMVSAHHFITLYIGLELQALSLYAMVALQRDSTRATEAAMKYFILGALSSGLLLYGMSMVYGGTGALELTAISKAIGSAQVSGTLLVFGLVFVVAGLAFKVGLVPFHMWIPDVYHGASTPATLFIAAAPKIAAFAFTIRVLVTGLQGMTADWAQMLVILAVGSLALGNVVAIAQTNLKRMLAYSTIGQMGFMVLGILSGTVVGYGAAMFYVITYVLTTLGTFGILMMATRAGFEAENLDDWKGLAKKSPWFAFLMMVLVFSLAGIPPTVGFFAKLSVLQSALDAGYIWLVVFAVVMSVIGAFYYLRIVKLMYMDEPAGELVLAGRSDTRLVLSANAFAALVLGILPGPLMDLCATAVKLSM
ncbi:NADH-quinone oxidoreductase subunit N [Usitatibacter rugosus]|uniref:NADH-quinone oxidoreductase subunit N n=1 Tax=Usitatibacter rugosus TaxID=2732067 RepID=A0A6M4GYJ2_9PROT|nr:NADH-quinone oxidoreductase subunit NuoN [Usitatibacter rugosus]QJR12306.1 NADH-quinone oxidoreductase subunit N [Usitatibacter rugosus]